MAHQQEDIHALMRGYWCEALRVAPGAAWQWCRVEAAERMGAGQRWTAGRIRRTLRWRLSCSSAEAAPPLKGQSATAEQAHVALVPCTEADFLTLHTLAQQSPSQSHGIMHDLIDPIRHR